MIPVRSDLSAIRFLIVDIDGVLWHGRDTLPGVPELFRFLEKQGIRFVIATNNSARPATDVIDRLKSIGVQVDEENVLTSAEATALFLPRLAPRGSRVLVVGGQGLTVALERAGYRLVDQNADVVVAGLDVNLTFDKLKRATIDIRRGAKFVGTNADRTFPATEGLVPGAGSILAAIEAATDVAPIVVGKPERAMFDMAVTKMGGTVESTAMLGDRLDTDIEGAQRAGLMSILVLTGVTTTDTLAQSVIKPDLVFPDLVALKDAWEKILKTY